MKQVDGYSVAAIGDAVDQLRLSEGISFHQLSTDSGVHARIIYGFVRGGSISDEKLRLVVTALNEGVREPFGSIEGLMQRSQPMKRITAESVHEALGLHVAAKGISLKELKRRANEQYPPLSNANGIRHGGDMEWGYYLSRTLGFPSIASMLDAAVSLAHQPDDAELVQAVEIMRSEKQIPQPAFVQKLGMSHGGYGYAVRNQCFSAKTKTGLIGALGGGYLTLQGIVDAAKALEPVPDRDAFAAAARTVRMHRGLSISQLAKKVGCNAETISRVEGRQDGSGPPAPVWLRLIARHLGCNSMQQVMEEAARRGPAEPLHGGGRTRNADDVLARMAQQLGPAAGPSR